MDAEECLCNCRFGGGCIVRMAANGSIDRIIEMPVRNITTCASTLFVTTASVLKADTDRQAGSLFSFEIGRADCPSTGSAKWSFSDMADLTERLDRCYSGAVYDVMRARGQENCVLPPEICGLDPDVRVAGPIFTLRGVAFDTQRDADTDYLLPWVRFLAEAPAGHVVLCQPNSDRLALMGELSAETLKSRGVRGYIVDGGSRDNTFIRRIGFPVFCRFRTPRDIVAKWVPDATGVPITIGDVLVRTGDYVLADFDGVVIIPAEIAEEVVSAVETVMTEEDKVREAIRNGRDPVEAYLEFGKF